MKYNEWKEKFVDDGNKSSRSHSVSKWTGGGRTPEEIGRAAAKIPKQGVVTTEINISGDDEKVFTIPPKRGIIDVDGEKMIENISGAISGALNPDSDEAIEHSEKYYELVRKMSTDVKNISANTGYSIEDIQKVKNYIFLETHDLGDGRIDKFDPDYMMAQSWQRLIDGKDIKNHDFTLLKHELLERDYESQGIVHDKAHMLASKKYNYSREAREYHVEINKHKEK